MQFNQLETFVCVAENGSFAKAAEKLYISGSAVFQQINSLEQSLGSELFFRLFYKFWGRFVSVYDMFQVRTVDISNPDTILNPSLKVDLIESINDGEFWQKNYSFLPICRDNIICAVPSSHPLANEKKLTYDMMRPYTLITAPNGLCSTLDALKKEVTDAGIKIKEGASYDLSLFTSCRINNWIIQIPEVWGYMCTDFVLIPCEWDYYHEYGFFYREPMNRPLKLFLDFVKEQLE